MFDRQKCDLSDKSNEDNERKKARERERERETERQRDRETERQRDRESSLKISLSKSGADIFEEGIESPRCAAILYSCLQNLEKEVNEIFELSSSTKEAQI